MKRVLLILMALSSASAFAGEYECLFSFAENFSDKPADYALLNVAVDSKGSGSAVGKSNVSGSDMQVTIANIPGTKKMNVIGVITNGEAVSSFTTVAKQGSKEVIVGGTQNATVFLLKCLKTK